MFENGLLSTVLRIRAYKHLGVTEPGLQADSSATPYKQRGVEFLLSLGTHWGHIGDTLIARKCVEPLAIDLLVPAALTPTLGLVL